MRRSLAQGFTTTTFLHVTLKRINCAKYSFYTVHLLLLGTQIQIWLYIASGVRNSRVTFGIDLPKFELTTRGLSSSAGQGDPGTCRFVDDDSRLPLS